MSEYIQIGQTALRDPLTGEMLPAVPLYIRKDEAPAAAAPLADYQLAGVLAAKFREYVDGCKREGVKV